MLSGAWTFSLPLAFLLLCSVDAVHPRVNAHGRWVADVDDSKARSQERDTGMIGFSPFDSGSSGSGSNGFSGFGESGFPAPGSSGFPEPSSTGVPGPSSGSSGYSNLSPWAQNGPSTWGTLNHSSLPYFDPYKGTHTGFSGFPWGSISTQNSNPYTSAPYTGVTRTYHFTVAPCNIKPDGVVAKGAVCVNGQYPGPLLSANYGDNVQVTVTNHMEIEGTSMLWHGFLQTNNNQNDGVPGVQQCAIAPGQSQTYIFRAELYGSSWYHTHYSAQYAGGAVGPIVIYGPYNSGYDVDLGPIMLSEWYRNDYMTSIQGLMRPLSKGGPILPLANSNLINGKMRFPCSKTTLPCATADYAKFNFTSGKNHRMRLMNTGAAVVQKFSIDNHVMEVIAHDFMPVQPYNTSMIALGVGQRADIVVHGSGKTGDKYWMRSNIVACSLNDGELTEARAVIYYQGADTKSLPTAGTNQGPAASTSIMSCANAPLTQTIPMYQIAAAAPSITKEFDIAIKSNGTNLLYYFGNESFRADFNDPLLTHALNFSLINQPHRRNVWNLGSAKVARVVIYNYDDVPHPIHMHGHNIQVLNLGMGKWDGAIVRSSNPMRRDVQLMPPALNTTVPSFLAFQWTADNPGVWPLHCHFAWHSSLGLVVSVVEQQNSISRVLKSVPASLAPVCSAWDAWAKTSKVLTDIDSGL